MVGSSLAWRCGRASVKRRRHRRPSPCPQIEAPERFQAIQSYRAAMAILRQQSAFVDELHGSGIVDDAEQRAMQARARAAGGSGGAALARELLGVLLGACGHQRSARGGVFTAAAPSLGSHACPPPLEQEPIDRRARQLEIQGPVWRAPSGAACLPACPPASASALLPDPFSLCLCCWTACCTRHYSAFCGPKPPPSTLPACSTRGAAGPALPGPCARAALRRPAGARPAAGCAA